MTELTNNEAPPAAERDRILKQGHAYLKAGDHRAAHAVADRLLNDFEDSPETLLFAGEVQFSRANFVGTEQIARRCTEQFPEDLSGPVLYCRALMALGRHGEARDLALTLAVKDVTLESHVDILVTILSGGLVPEAAYPLCKKSVERDPYNAAAHRRLALNCRLLGKLDEAIQAADIALRFDAHDYEMITLRSALQTATPENNRIDELETLLAAGCRNALGAAGVAYALSKECEDCGQSERAFGFLEAGANFKRQTMKYDIAVDLETFEKLRSTFTTEALDRMGQGFATEEPIFILGLPRTGSTLLERILSSHSGVYAAGELHHLDAAMMEEIRKLGPIANRSELIAKSAQADMTAIGRGYLERTRPFTGHTPRFIDKRPLNYLSLGIIHSALPNAKIIHVRRTPLDACFAIYKFLFGDAYAWSYKLDEIGQYYVGYRRLMDHWRTVIPGKIIDVKYEDLVLDLESESRRLLEKVGLEWEAACLAFHENAAATMTGSAVQVRQKIYTSSVGRWRDYEAQLKPLADTLAAAGIDPYTP